MEDCFFAQLFLRKKSLVRFAHSWVSSEEIIFILDLKINNVTLFFAQLLGDFFATILGKTAIIHALWKGLFVEILTTYVIQL